MWKWPPDEPYATILLALIMFLCVFGALGFWLLLCRVCRDIMERD